ncbi:MAG: DUF885 family protein [Kofleriaceae bacterium]
MVPGDLDADDRITHAPARRAAGGGGGGRLRPSRPGRCRLAATAWSASWYLPELGPIATEADGANFLSRLAQAPAPGRRHHRQPPARAGCGTGGAGRAIRRAVAQLDGELAQPVRAWAMASPAAAPAPAGWPEARHQAFTATVVDTIEREVRPALVRLRALLADELLPRGRASADEGLGGLPDGARCCRP